MPSDKDKFPKGGGSEATVVTDALVDYTVQRLAFSVRKYQLKKEVSLILYGGKIVDGEETEEPIKLIAIMSFERLCKKAREILHNRSVSGSQEARNESIGFYENLIADSTVSDGVRIKARENLDKIHNVVAADPAIPLTGVLTHQIIDIDKLGLTLEQKKALLEKHRAGSDGT